MALWSAEEQGLLGSQAYVKEHFGTFEQPKPEFSKLVAYFNVDSGTGRPRGGSVFGPPEAADVVVKGNQEAPDSAARRVMARLLQKHFLEEDANDA